MAAADTNKGHIALEAVIKTRGEYILVGSTAASVPQTVLITASRAITQHGFKADCPNFRAIRSMQQYRV